MDRLRLALQVVIIALLVGLVVLVHYRTASLVLSTKEQAEDLQDAVQNKVDSSLSKSIRNEKQIKTLKKQVDKVEKAPKVVVLVSEPTPTPKKGFW